ncbi:ATP-binding cassette domain-containing protein [Planococcus sp. ISL-110]|uniref:ATP-binding cassette domain-containing protein n=1 Tax=Planococcus sp. ISL-110 TaxID=2819167 RepID=UPI001BED26CC|nr:ATP-binding cassette domain-containing protein [Planococcus sp. ISL-110]MBT2570660.1 ATP-binding cassette domain-containing protein [Planococcus sp. ISL-110]
MSPVIRLSHLFRRYKTFSAVENISLEIGKGEICGFIGLNGSGKTTTIKMLLGMVHWSSLWQSLLPCFLSTSF